MRAIQGAKIVLEDMILEGYTLIYDQKIIDVVKDEDFKGDVELEKFDGYIMPGFIDIHIHGAGGCDAMDASEEALRTIQKSVVKGGTTSFLATTMTMSTESIVNALQAIEGRLSTQERGDGAEILGCHLEGPFICHEYKGAQNPEYIQKPNEEWLKPFYPMVKLITMAPEQDENMKHVKKWSEMGIVVSCGHTSATFEQLKEAYRAGARHITHCFNGMRGLHHREPGVVGGALLLPFTAEMITDGIHFRPELMEMVYKMKGREKVVLITDAIRAAFLNETESELGGQKVFIKDGACRLESGSLAGSIHQMRYALTNMLKYTTAHLTDIVKMLTVNPARLIGVDDRKARLQRGYDADFVLFNNDFELQATYVYGRKQDI